MNIFYRILIILQSEMNKPTAFGWFHILCIILTIISIFILYKLSRNYNEKQLKIVLAIYGVVALILELLKQIIWSFNFDIVTNIVTWDYEWYAFPFQLCTTPIFVSLICLFLRDNKVRKSLLSYVSFVTILGSISTIIVPDSCFVPDILVNIHTMWLHCGAFVLSIYLIISGEVELKKENLVRGLIVFIIFVLIAQILNIVIYNIGILNDETFNMFFISPYFNSTLPVFDMIQKSVPYIIFLLSYIFVLSTGAVIIYYMFVLIKKIVINNKSTY